MGFTIKTQFLHSRCRLGWAVKIQMPFISTEDATVDRLSSDPAIAKPNKHIPLNTKSVWVSLDFFPTQGFQGPLKLIVCQGFFGIRRSTQPTNHSLCITPFIIKDTIFGQKLCIVWKKNKKGDFGKYLSSYGRGVNRKDTHQRQKSSRDERGRMCMYAIALQVRCEIYRCVA